MKWKKLGQLFNIKDYQISNGLNLYAKSPQVIIYDHYIRIFFSTVFLDQNNKYLSQVYYADFDKNFTKVIKISQNPVISLGELGCFDEHGIFPFNVIRVDNKIYSYTTGWNRKKSVSADASIGLAISYDDGNTFQKFGHGPIMTANLTEPFLVADAFVIKLNTIFHMWYIFGERWIESSLEEGPQRVYKIAHASSTDGINWLRDGKKIIKDKRNKDECQALPTVIKHDDLFHMYFCHRDAIGFRTNKDSMYRIGYAYSSNLINWTRDDSKAGIDISESGWDSNMMCYPHIFKLENKIYLLYNGNEFGKYGFGLAVLEN